MALDFSRMSLSTAGSIFAFGGRAPSTDATGACPRAARNSSAHTGTAGKGAALSSKALTATAIAAWKASQTASNWPRDASSSGGNLASTLAQFASSAMSLACDCQCATSACNASNAVCASRHGLMDSTSMRCAISTAASRCTWVRCCRSSMVLTRSASCTFRPASGSLDSGAPALAASRCQASASARLSLPVASSAEALAAHSAATTSWPLLRLASSSFSLSGLAAPLSRLARSL